MAGMMLIESYIASKWEE